MLDVLLEGFFEILGELILEPFRLLIHWVVRSCGGANPRYYRMWHLGCWSIILLSIFMFCGTVVSIIIGLIGPLTMLGLFALSFVVFVISTCALNALVWEPPSLKAPPHTSPTSQSELPSSQQIAQHAD